MQAYLFGAGASHSYSLSPTGVSPPLAKGFFEAYNKLTIAEDLHVLVGAIVSYVRETRGVNPISFGNWHENIEDFLTEIDEQIGIKDKALELKPEERFFLGKAYQEMIFLFTSVLNEIQNGPPCPNYTSLVQRLNLGDILITFNWDTLLDRALWNSGKWNPATGYGLDFRGFFDNEWREEAPEGETNNLLLKLHGSTNWLMPFFTIHIMEGVRVFINKAVDPFSRPIFCFIKAEDEYTTYQNRSKVDYAPFSYYYYPPDIPIVSKKERGITNVGIVSNILSPEHGKITVGGHPFASMPLIVPPVRHKDYGILGNTLDNIWQKALDAISTCDHLTIIGYSFPITDIRAWELIQRAVDSRNTTLKVTVIDPYPEQLVTRLNSNLKGKCEVDYHEALFSDYIRKNQHSS